MKADIVKLNKLVTGKSNWLEQAKTRYKKRQQQYNDEQEYMERNSYKNKLKALLEGLETQNVCKLLKEGKTGDFRNYGKAYIASVRDKVNAAKTCR